MKSATLMTILLLAVTGTAEPILWYHFDEGPAGTKAVTDTGAIVNAANPGALNGTVKGVEWDGTSAIVKQNIYYTNALDVATAWYDPVSGAKGDTTGIYVSITDPVIGSGSSGLVTVPDDGSLQVNRFTVEFFFRKEAGTAFKNGPVYPIQLYNSSTNTVAWQIALGKYSNAIVVNAHTRAGKLRTKRYENLWFGDGCWHHIAMTYDGTQLELFFDYKSLGAFDCELEYAENVSKSLMAIGNNYRVKLYRYHGRLDEVRLCDEVLTVDQFLRPMPLLCDADTLVYVSGKTSGLADFGGFGKTNNLNEVWNGQTVVPTIMYVGRLPSSEDSVPSATVRSDLYATNVVADASSLFFETNAAASEVGRTARLELNDVVGGRHTLLTNDAMTIEFFIKPSPQAADCNNNKYLIGCHTGLGCHSLFIRKGDHAAQWAVYGEDGSTNEWISSRRLRDGSWHHVAMVQDSLRRECSLYIDHALDKIFTNVVMDASAHTGSYFKNFNFCAAYNGTQPTGYRGWMDEIRITRRALLPSEFLSTWDVPEIAKVGGKQVLFYAPFDTDAAAYPFPGDSMGTVAKCTLETARRPLEVIEARADMGLEKANVASLYGNGGSVTYADVSTLAGCKSLTIEFYANAPKAGANTPLVRYEGERVGFEVAKSSEGQVAVRLRTDKMSVGSYIRFDTAKLNRCSWHHYAVTLERKVVADEVVTETRVYVDHQEMSLAPGETTNQFPGEIPSRLADMKLYLGKAKTWGNLTGSIDEVRITEGVLGVENFLDACPRLGALFIVR